MRYWILLFLLISVPQVHGQTSCSALFSSIDFKQSRQLITQLAQMRLTLDLNQAHGNHSPWLLALQSAYGKKETEVIHHFEKSGLMTRAQLIEAIKSETFRIQNESAIKTAEEKKESERQKEEIENSVLGRKLSFHDIKGGHFKMGQGDRQVDVEITKPFAMASILTTQIVWKKIAQAAKNRFAGSYDALDLNPSRFKGDLNPVEQVSYEDIELWLRALGELSRSDDPVVKEVLPEHKAGDIYRLPTNAEWEFVARNRGAATGRYYFGENQDDLEQYAWLQTNSDQSTQPVGLRKPFLVDGGKFYDMYGNVSEWIADAYVLYPPGGIDPYVKDDKDIGRIFRGGSWGDRIRDICTSGHYFLNRTVRADFVGFRLVKITAP
jgi:formylglycine-generating enzyme required for sulfatase activity